MPVTTGHGMTNEYRALTAPWWNCPICGYRNAESEYRCHKCGRRLQTIQTQAELNPSLPAGNPGLFPPPGDMPELASSSTARTKRTSAENSSREAFPNAPGKLRHVRRSVKTCVSTSVTASRTTATGSSTRHSLCNLKRRMLRSLRSFPSGSTPSGRRAWRAGRQPAEGLDALARSRQGSRR